MPPTAAPVARRRSAIQRPNFQIMWNSFAQVAPPPAPSDPSERAQRAYLIDTLKKVGDTIGGKVKTNFDLGVKDVEEYKGPGLYPANPIGFTNGCATRMSYVLHKAGITIPPGQWQTVTGDDHQRYIFKVADMKRFLQATFGPPDLVKTSNPQPRDFAGRKGIITFDVHFSDASGHVTLWNGSQAIDQDEFNPGRGLICSKAQLWECP